MYVVWKCWPREALEPAFNPRSFSKGLLKSLVQLTEDGCEVASAKTLLAEHVQQRVTSTTGANRNRNREPFLQPTDVGEAPAEWKQTEAAFNCTTSPRTKTKHAHEQHQELRCRGGVPTLQKCDLEKEERSDHILTIPVSVSCETVLWAPYLLSCCEHMMKMILHGG